MKRLVSLTLVLVLLATAGCANLTTRQQQTLSGAAIGAASGAAIGFMVGGSPVVGAAIGGVAGAAAGALWEDIKKSLH